MISRFQPVLSTMTRLVPGALFVMGTLVLASTAFASPNGRVLTLQEYRETAAAPMVTYLDFWASWCAPCQQSFPFMQTLQSHYAPYGLRVVAVSLDRERADAQRFLEQVSADFDIVLDPEAALTSEYDVPAMPTSYVLERDGRVVSRHQGFRAEDKARLEAAVRDVLRVHPSVPSVWISP